MVTGAGQGIGAAIAEAFGRRGRAAAVATNVADYPAVEAACGRLQQALGGPFDTLVNNAGAPRSTKLTPSGRWRSRSGAASSAST